MTFAGLVGNLTSLVNNAIIPLLFALAVVFFLVNILRFFFIEGGEEGQTKGRKAILFGLIGLFVLFSIWGILNLLLATLTSFTSSAAGAATTTASTQIPASTQ